MAGYGQVVSPREKRFDRNQEMFRIVNERIAEVAAQWGGDDLFVICECANTGCAERLDVPLDVYDAIREHPGSGRVTLYPKSKSSSSGTTSTTSSSRTAAARDPASPIDTARRVD
jgi:hypothetical protein